MFTGIIEEIGVVAMVSRGVRSSTVTISASKVLDDVKLGDSIAVNGVCLTVTSFDKNRFSADVMPETMSRSNLGEQSVGSRVNLERALRVGDRLGGHMVSGHIDGCGEVLSISKDDNAIWVRIKTDRAILKYIIQKGSIAIDGISLTVAKLDDLSFSVSIIPLTQDETTLTKRKIGSTVNLENDLTAKYIERMLTFKDDVVAEKKSSITESFLRENGF